MRCMICGQNVSEAGALLRVNDKGNPGVWSCKPHYESARAYFPDDNPSAPGPMPADDWDSKPLGPWTGGVSVLENSKAGLADATNNPVPLTLSDAGSDAEGRDDG